MRIRPILTACAVSLMASTAQAVTVTETFGVGADFDDGPGTLAFSLSGLDPAVISDIAINFTFLGDLNALSENFTLFLDGVNYGTGCDLNTGNDSFGISTFGIADLCSQAANSLTNASLLVSATDAVGLLADGALDLVFSFTQQVNDFVVINNGGETRNGVFFGNTAGVSFAAGGTVSYETSTIAPIPLPPMLPVMVAGLAGLALLRRQPALA